jgi:hypothetical protein
MVLARVLPSIPRGVPADPCSDRICCLLPSPRHDRLGSPEHLSADSLTRLQRSLLMVAARVLAPPLTGAFDAALRQTASRPLPAACYRALRRLPGRDFHPLDHRDLTGRYRIAPGLARLQDAPWPYYTRSASAAQPPAATIGVAIINEPRASIAMRCDQQRARSRAPPRATRDPAGSSRAADLARRVLARAEAARAHRRLAGGLPCRDVLASPSRPPGC